MAAIRRLIPSFNRVLVEKVVAVGPGNRDKEGKLIPVALQEGDHVLLPEYGGLEVKLAPEKEYLLYREDDILGTLHE
uniref:10 kDa chaperonin n=1 Tax=Hordeum vulgare subsp. vulgare TaxID=112509 RepID=A0A8I6WRZ8_HORVV